VRAKGRTGTQKGHTEGVGSVYDDVPRSEQTIKDPWNATIRGAWSSAPQK